MQKHKEGEICAILREKTPFLAFPDAQKGVVNCPRMLQGCARLRTCPIITQTLGAIRKKGLLCRKARYVRSLGKKPHFWSSQRLTKLSDALSCMHKGNKCIQSLWDHPKKIPFVQKHKEGAIFAILRENTSFLAFPEAKKAIWRSQLHAQRSQMHSIPLGPSKKKFLFCKSTKKARYVRSLGKKPHFWPTQRLKKVLLTAQGCARLCTGPTVMQIPRGYQKKSLLCGKSAILLIRWEFQF